LQPLRCCSDRPAAIQASPNSSLAVAGSAGRGRVARDLRCRDARSRADYKLPDCDPARTARHWRASQAEFVQCRPITSRRRRIARLAEEASGSEKYRPRWTAIEARFGCPYIVLAIWGRETDYGRYTLPYDGLRVLATQAYVGRRQGPVSQRVHPGAEDDRRRRRWTRKDLRASWAGATGLSNSCHRILSARVDFDGDGRRTLAIRCGTRSPPLRSNSSTRAGRRECAGL